MVCICPWRSDGEEFKIRVDVSVELEERTVHEVWGIAAGTAVADLPEVGRWVEDERSVRSFMPFRHVDVGRILVVGETPGVTAVPASAVEPFRIEIGEPVMGIDLTEKTIPQEGVDIGAAVDFTKGCYLGQELVARIDSRGHVNRRLTGVVISAEISGHAWQYSAVRSSPNT